MSLPEYEEILGDQFSGIQAAIVGGPTQEDDVFVDQTLQYNKVEGRPYENTLKHELRHRGLASERAARLNDVPEGASVIGEEWKKRGNLRDVERREHPIYELIRQLQVGEKNIEELGYEDRVYLKSLNELETNLLGGMTEEERMRLGFIPEKKELGFIDKLMSIMD
jgi:hypothetical protein